MVWHKYKLQGKFGQYCLNLLHLTCSGNYPLYHYCLIFIGSNLLHHLLPNFLYFCLTSDINRLTATCSLPPIPYIINFGLTVLTFFSSHHLLMGRWVKVRDLLPVAFGTCCYLICFDPSTSPKCLCLCYVYV